MSIHTILSQEITTFKGTTFSSPEQVEEWLRSFATRIVEEVGKELIGEDELKGELHPENHPSYFWSTVGRNALRKEQRTKLQNMKGDI